METEDRTLYQAFQDDETTLKLRQLRSTLGSRLDESLALVHKLASGDESLNFKTIEDAQIGLLRAHQIQYAINVACSKIKGHDTVTTKIMSNMQEQIKKAVIYMNEVNRWVSVIQGTGLKA